MKTGKYLFLIAASGMLVWQSCGNSNSGKTDSTTQASEVNEQKETVSDSLSHFMVEAAAGGMAEVELGNLAQKNGQSARVKAFGAMMVKDHSKANEELKALASAKNVTLPATLSDEHQKHMEAMQKMTGADFDKHYMDMMNKDHVDDITLFDETSKSSIDPEVKAFAAKTLPILKMHLDSAKRINEAIKK
ncbi:DUF4142 domain-containing protein [Arcticibacter sp. MXS-1]|uniref:DUF4142 domain-containing protein n=1 Tax=Arcticibacter sp. MXS-1 TaxID=3341726 RepID=UPI0035A83144